MLKLKNVLLKAGCKQADLAKALNVSQATVAQIVNHGEWPKSLDELDLQERICDFLEAKGVAQADLTSVFEEVDQADVREQRGDRTSKSGPSNRKRKCGKRSRLTRQRTRDEKDRHSKVGDQKQHRDPWEALDFHSSKYSSAISTFT